MNELVCAVCLYDESGDAAETALTVIEGYAVCEDHLGFVAQGERYAAIVRAVRTERKQKADWDARNGRADEAVG